MKHLITYIALLISGLVFSQSGINYKAVIKDGSGNILASQPVDLQFIIYEGATLTNNVYQESHTVNTDANGILIVTIGDGSTSDNFTNIDWGNDEHWLNVQMDTGTGLVDMGTTQFKAVPYAIVAEKANNVNGLEKIDEGSGEGWRIKGKDPLNYGNIGVNSVDLSTSNVASTSFGATGGYALATGDGTIASGPTSTAMGRSTVASGSASTALGVLTKAESFGVTVLGRYNVGGGDPGLWSSNDPIFEIGIGSGAVPLNALTVLKNGIITAPSLTNSMINSAGAKALVTKEYADLNMASGLEALDEGNGIGWRLIGRDPTSYGNIGVQAIDLSYSDSNSTTKGATGPSALSSGTNTTASGRSSVAFGLGSVATGNESASFGTFTSATGENSTAIGSNNVASGYASLASGLRTEATGTNSVAFGELTKANAINSFVVGANNIGGGNPTMYVATDPIFEIGNATSPTIPSNALTVLKNGTITAPDFSISEINLAGDKALITKEFIDELLIEEVNDLYVGYDAGQFYTGNSENNVGIGPRALQDNTSGQNNTAVGHHALRNNTEANSNTAMGSAAMNNTTTGFQNTAVGRSALAGNTSGDNNTAIGYSALTSNTTGSNNTAIGYDAEVPVGDISNQVRIGNTSVIYTGVQIAWSITSDVKWKDKIRDLPYGLNMLSRLRPVDYIRKNNDQQTREIGFVAQEIQELLAELHYDDQGMLTEDDKGYLSLRYNDLIPVLVKAIQEQQIQIQELREEVKKLKPLKN